MRERFDCTKEGVKFLEVRFGEDAGVYVMGESMAGPLTGPLDLIADQFGVKAAAKFEKMAAPSHAAAQARVSAALTRVEEKVAEDLDSEPSQRYPE